jgi:RDD family
MPVNGPDGREIASLRRRSLASLIDTVVLLLPIALAAGGGVWLYMSYLRRRSDEYDSQFDFAERLPFRHLAEPRWRLAMWGAGLAIEIGLRNWRSPGARAMGLRSVDARAGGPVTVRGVLMRNAVDTASSELNRLVQRPFQERIAERQRALRAELMEVRRAYGDDGEAELRARVNKAQRRHNLSPWGSCGRGPLGLLPKYLPALWSARNQTLPDRVAGIVVVVERDR